MCKSGSYLGWEKVSCLERCSTFVYCPSHTNVLCIMLTAISSCKYTHTEKRAVTKKDLTSTRQ